MKTQKQTKKNTIHTSESLGMLLWIVTPFRACLLLRGFAGDGWKNFGIRLNFKGNLIGYVVSILIFPVITALILAIGNFILNEFLPVFTLALIPGFLKTFSKSSPGEAILRPGFFLLT